MQFSLDDDDDDDNYDNDNDDDDDDDDNDDDDVDDDDDGGIQVEDKTEQLSNDAKDWALASAKLRDKYKNQKWYQF